MDHIHIADLTFHVFGDHVCKQYLVYLRRNRVQWWVECRSAVVRPLFLLAIPIPQALKGPTTLHPSRFVRRLLSFARSAGMSASTAAKMPKGDASDMGQGFVFAK